MTAAGSGAVKSGIADLSIAANARIPFVARHQEAFPAFVVEMISKTVPDAVLFVLGAIQRGRRRSKRANLGLSAVNEPGANRREHSARLLRHRRGTVDVAVNQKLIDLHSGVSRHKRRHAVN